MEALATPSQIDRFRIVKPLGQGGQGRVFLAHDTRLDRDVAIKTLTVRPTDREAYARLLEAEAQTVSRLVHPHIVTLFDAGSHRGEPYLVLEYVPGQTLRHLLSIEERLPVVRAVETTLQVLEAVGYAHRQGVIHRDLKPANIMIDGGGNARVMDFGIAVTLGGRSAGTVTPAGTPPYAAPEYRAGGNVTPAADLYSVAMVLYEMLTGRTAADAPAAPSTLNPDVDAKLDAIVLRGLARRPEDRHESAAAMSAALRDYLEPAEEIVDAGDGKGAVEFLLRRMRSKGDFPALSDSIRAINRIASSDEESVTQLAGVILKDFALTNKLLKVVNAATYKQFGRISTISRAVVVLGFNAVRHIACSLILFHHLQNKAQATHLKDEMAASLLGATIARNLMAQYSKDAEEASICAMFSGLGKLLAMYYFHDETLEIARLVQQGQSAEQAAATVLGISYEMLGTEIARQWNFPERMLRSMQRVTDDRLHRPATADERFRAVVGLACDLRDASIAAPDVREKRLQAILQRYGECLTVTRESLTTLVDASLRSFTAEAQALDLDVRDSRVVRRLGQPTFAGVPTAPAAPVTDAATTEVSMEAEALEPTLSLDDAGTTVEVSQDTPLPGRSIEPAVLSAGIQDITNTMVSDYDLNDLLRMILETIYRGMPFSRVLLGIRDVRQNAIVGRFGLGEGIEELSRRFRVPLPPGPDIFGLALGQGRDIVITDSTDPRLSGRLPAWYRERVNAPSFVVLPILVNKKPIGLLYADQLAPGLLDLGKKEASLLMTLRNQAVLAFKQKL